MKSNLANVIVEVAKFLEKKVPNEEEMVKLLTHLSFDSMKTNPAVNYANNESKYHFLRKGIVGDHKNHMSEEIEKQFDEWIIANDKDKIFF